MKPGRIFAMKHVKEYWKPATIQEAVTLLQEHPGTAVCLAGGTHIAVVKDPAIEYLVDLTSCGLNTIQQDDTTIRIGACVTLEELRTSEAVRSLAGGILAEVAGWTGSAQRRNASTLGGSLVMRRDIALPLLALDAQIVIIGKAERVVPLAALYANSGTALQPGEIITECRIDAALTDLSGAVQRQSRTRQDISIAAVATVVTRAGDQCTNAAIAVAPVEAGMGRVPAAEQHLKDQTISADIITGAVNALRETIQPITDHRASAEYRRHVLGVYTQRALTQCFNIK